MYLYMSLPQEEIAMNFKVYMTILSVRRQKGINSVCVKVHLHVCEFNNAFWLKAAV